MFQKLEEVEKRYEEVTQKISDPEVISRQEEWKALMKEHAEIEPVVLKYREYKKANQAIDDAKALLNDPEMKELAELDIEENKEKLPKLEEEIKNMANAYRIDVERAKQRMGEEGLEQMKEDLAVQEAVDFLVAEAKLV